MEPAIVGGRGSVVEVFGPPGDTSTEVCVAFQDVDGDAAFGQTGGRGQACDPRADHHNVRYLRQVGGTRQPTRCRVCNAVRILHRDASPGASARKVCTILRCQPSIVSLCTPVKPDAAKRRLKSEAPSKVFTLRHRWR